MSFFGSGRVGIRVTGQTEIIAAIQAMISEGPSVRIRILREAADFFVRDAKKNIHHITHKTERSTKIESVTDKQAIISSAYGAPFEEKRDGTKNGTTHKFMSEIAAPHTAAIMPNIIKRHYDELLRRHRTR